MQPWDIRFYVRTAVAGLLAGLAIAGTIWIDNPYIKIASGVLGVLGGYLGVGLVTPVEPFVGVGKENRVEVPSPPADEVAE